jgi:L-methionine (R)-S-oxide reductase
MHTVQSIADGSKAAVYRQLHEHMSALFADERSGLANAANMSALLYEALPNLNWAGQGCLCSDCARTWCLRHCR